MPAMFPIRLAAFRKTDELPTPLFSEFEQTFQRVLEAGETLAELPMSPEEFSCSKLFIPQSLTAALGDFLESSGRELSPTALFQLSSLRLSELCHGKTDTQSIGALYRLAQHLALASVDHIIAVLALAGEEASQHDWVSRQLIKATLVCGVPVVASGSAEKRTELVFAALIHDLDSLLGMGAEIVPSGHGSLTIDVLAKYRPMSENLFQLLSSLGERVDCSGLSFRLPSDETPPATQAIALFQFLTGKHASDLGAMLGELTIMASATQKTFEPSLVNQTLLFIRNCLNVHR